MKRRDDRRRRGIARDLTARSGAQSRAALGPVSWLGDHDDLEVRPLAQALHRVARRRVSERSDERDLAPRSRQARQELGDGRTRQDDEDARASENELEAEPGRRLRLDDRGPQRCWRRGRRVLRSLVARPSRGGVDLDLLG